MASIVSDNTTTAPDGSTTRTIIYSDGSRSVQFTPGPGTPAANLQSLAAKLVTALATNTTYIALASPSTAQNTAEIKALAQHVDALIRLVLPQIDSMTGT